MIPFASNTARRMAAFAFACVVAAAPAHADERAEIERLAAAGQHEQALTRLERLLAERPRDPQLRFQKGVLLAETRRPAEAMDVFARLAADYPEIPEPHNNLAVLHAAAGDYDKARAALDAALRANPNYAVAHLNLGDIYTQLARLSYLRAQKLDPSNPAVAPRLDLMRQLTHLAEQPAAGAPPTVTQKEQP